jgi:UTP--glucose-1-phosphate uridylyltransferase
MRIQKAVIPAAGLGTRLLPLTRSQPKEMLPLGRKPVIQYVVDEIQSAGVDRILIITTQSKRSIEEHFSGDISSGEIFYVHQAIRSDLPYGLGYAVGLSEGFVGDDPFLVCLGDCIVKSDSSDTLLKRLIYTHETYKASATIAFEEVPLEIVSRYGVAKPRGLVGEEFQLDDIIEKPSREEAPSNLAVAARYILGPEIFSYIKETLPGAGGELQLTDAVRSLLKNGHPVWGVKLRRDEVRYDIGGFAGYFKAFFDFSLADEDSGEEFKQYVREWICGCMG